MRYGLQGYGDLVQEKKYLLHEALKSCRNAYYIEETQLKNSLPDRKGLSGNPAGTKRGKIRRKSARK